MKITYKQVIDNQRKYKDVYYSLYRRFSSPLTYIFANLGLTPITISIISFIALMASLFLFSLNNIYVVFGFVGLMLHKILDCCDGAVARLNPKQMTPQRTWEGPYFDSVIHMVEPIAYGIGIGLLLQNFYSINLFYGILLTIVFNMETSSKFVFKYYYRRKLIENNIRVDNLKQKENDIINNFYKNSFPKLIKISLSKELFPTVGLVLFLIDVFTGAFLLLVYLIIFLLFRIYYITVFLILVSNKKPLSQE